MSQKPYTSIVFEELESRLLFSADIGEVFAAGAVVDEYVEEPVIVVELEEKQETNIAPVDQPAQEDTNVSAIELSEAPANEFTESDLTENIPSEVKTPEQSPSTNIAGSLLNTDISHQNVVAVPAIETHEIQTDGTSSTEQPRSELVFINDTVRDKEQLVDDLLRSDTQDPLFEVIILDSEEDGINQVNIMLQEYEDLDAIHFVTHGSDGQISLGNTWINNTTLKELSDSISAWGSALSENGDILFYGCNIAAGNDGHTLLDNISDLTGASVAASEDITGNTSLGGDWDLELNLGEIDTQVAFSAASQSEWNHSLADPVLTLPTGDLSYTAGSGSVIVDSMATVTDVDSPDFDIGLLRVSFTSGGTVNDRLTIRNQGNSVGEISIAGSNIKYHIYSPPTIIGTFSGGTDGSTDLLILFNSNSTPEAVQEILRNITYENVSPTPNTSTRTIRFELQDGDGGTTSLTRNITFSGINNSPAITSNGGGDIANITVPENTSVVTTVTASDVDGDIPTFAITGGADQALFSISAGGIVSFNSGQDFESPNDNGNDNIYEAEITASDGKGGTDIQNIQVFITDTNEIPTLITLSSTSLDENTDTSSGYSVGSLNTVDQDIPDTFTYTLIGGADVGNFSLSSNDLVLTDGIVDFETKSSYELTVQVTDSGNLTYNQTFTVNVIDLNEAPADESPIPASTPPNSDPVANTENSTIPPTPEHNGIVDPDNYQNTRIISSENYQNTTDEITTQRIVDEVLLEDLIEEDTRDTPHDTQIPLTQPINISQFDKEESENKKNTEEPTNAENATANDETTARSPHGEVELLTKDSLAEYYKNSEGYPEVIEANHSPSHIKLATKGDYTRLLLRNFIGQVEEDFKADRTSGSLFTTYLQPVTPNDIEAANAAMQLGIKQMHEDMEMAFEKEEVQHKLTVFISGGVAASLAAGVASYMLRAGSLIASFLSTIPLWKGFDPVAVLEMPKTSKDKMKPKRKTNNPEKTSQQKDGEMFEDDE